MKDPTGELFGNLTVTLYEGGRLAECVCGCGRKVVVNVWHLKQGNTISCGCQSQRTRPALLLGTVKSQNSEK